MVGAKASRGGRAMGEKRPRTQCAAVPYAIVDNRLCVLLVTSRDTGRWIVPKGWPKKKVKPCDQAAQEAFEEAGVIGKIAKKPIGSYRYQKRLKKGSVACDVEVFLLKAEREAEDWRERQQRTKRWMPPAEAAGLVSEAGLAELLLKLGDFLPS